MLHKKTKGKMYRYANIYCCIGSDMSTVTGNFDYLVCTITPNKLDWKDPIYWKADNNNMLDISKMRAYAESKRNLQDAEKLAEERRQVFQQTIFK